MKYNFLWRLAIPLLLASLAGQAHADLIATVDVSAAQHWTNVTGHTTDDLPFTPFAGAISSKLTFDPHGRCKAAVNPASHFSQCLFSADLSQIDSPTEDSYLPRFGDPMYLGSQLQTFLNFHDDGSYYATFTFIHYAANLSNDDDNTYEMTLDTDYTFTFEGTGMSNSTKIDADLAAWLWTNAPLTGSSFSILWSSIVSDLITGSITVDEVETWEGQMNATRGISHAIDVPEPASPALLLAGLVAIGYANRKRKLAPRT
jgi:hypothetical protein